MSRPGQLARVSLLLLPSAVVLGPLVGQWVSPDGQRAILAVAFNQPGLIVNTVVYGALTALAATLLGWGLAHLQHLYAPPGRVLLHNLALAPLLMPSFTFAMALIMLFGHSGLAVRAVGLPGGLVYGFVGLTAAGTLARLPIAYLALGHAYRSLDMRVFEAAADLGASNLRVLRSILLPRLSRTLVATGCLIMADTVADLAVPLVLAGDVGTLAARVVEAASGEGDLTMAVAYAAWLLPMGLVLIPLANQLSSRPEATGTTRRPFVRPLDRAGVILLVGGWVTAGLVAVLLVAVVVGSFLTAVGVDARPTLSHFADIVAGSQTRALATSVLTSMLAVPLVMAGVAGLTALVTLGGAPGVRRIFETVAAVPGIVWGLGAFVLVEVARPESWETAPWAHLGGWGAMGIILMVHVVRFVPQASGSLLRAAEDAAPRVRDTAVVLGAERAEVARALVVPALRSEWLNAGLVVFARTLTAISSVVLLTNAQVPLLSVRMLVDVEAGRLSSAAAMNVTLAVLVAGAVLGVRLLGPPAERSR